MVSVLFHHLFRTDIILTGQTLCKRNTSVFSLSFCFFFQKSLDMSLPFLALDSTSDLASSWRILIQGYEKGSGKTCSQPWALHVHSKWILNPQHRHKTCIKWGQENCSAEETNLCLQQPSPLSSSPHQYSLTIPGNPWLGSNYILVAITSGMACSQPTLPFLRPSWGKCRATKSRKGFRNTDHIQANINGATQSSESNVFPYKKWGKLASTSEVLLLWQWSQELRI